MTQRPDDEISLGDEQKTAFDKAVPYAIGVFVVIVWPAMVWFMW